GLMQRLKRNCSNRRFAQHARRRLAAKRTPILRILVRQLLTATELSKNKIVPAKRKSHSRRHPGSGNRENTDVRKELRRAHARSASTPPPPRPSGPRRRADDVNRLTVWNVQAAT